MKILLVIALIPYLLTGPIDATHQPKSVFNQIENTSKASSTKHKFNTLLKNTKTTYDAINAKKVKLIIPSTSDIAVGSVITADDTLQLSFSTTNDTMITSIDTILRTSSTSSLVTLELDVTTGAITTLGQSVTSLASAAPVESLTLEVVLETSDIGFGGVLTSNVSTTVKAVAATGSRIQGIQTKTQTIKGSTKVSIELTSTYCCNSTSTSLTPSTIITHTNGISSEGSTVKEQSTRFPTTVKEQSTRFPTTVKEQSTSIPTTVEEQSTRFPTTVKEQSTRFPTTVKEQSTSIPTTVKEQSTRFPSTNPMVYSTNGAGTNSNANSTAETVTSRAVSTLRTTESPERTTKEQIDTTNTPSSHILPTSERNYSNFTYTAPNVTTSVASNMTWYTTSNQTDVSNISFESTISSSERTTINATSRAENVTTRGLTTSHWHSTMTPTADSCDGEYSCVNCTTARVCAPTAGGQDLREVARFSCPDNAPWCDSHSGTCSRVRSPECDLPVVGDLTCMRDGHFPDPNFCSDYYLCDDDVPLQSTCLYPTPYYSPVSRSCSNSSSDCVDYVSLCKDKSGLKVPVPRVQNLFLYCVDGAVEVVDRCIGAYMFDFERQQCVPECPHVGLFPRDDDCAGYYRCSPSPVGDTYVMTNLTCPQGKAFSESAYECVDRSLVHNCNVTYIS